MAKMNGVSGADGLRGRLGNIVYSQTQSGETIARAYAPPRQPNTPKQARTKAAMGRAGQAWRDLTPEQAAAWQDYALSLTTTDAGTGRARTPRPQNVFTALALKLQQRNPAAVLPVLPPSQAFFGDGIRVTISGGSGEMVFTASGPNSANVATELLIQPLPSIHRKPEAAKHRSAAFVDFGLGILDFGLPADAGIYAAAVRFVQVETGQAGPLIAVGKARVS